MLCTADVSVTTSAKPSPTSPKTVSIYDSLPHRNKRSRLSISLASFLRGSLSKATSTRLCEGLESSAERLGWHTAHHSSMINEDQFSVHFHSHKFRMAFHP
jgi:hypothetical protein